MWWIHKTIIVCPVCGSEIVYRERRYTKKPKQWRKRNKVEEVFDYCNV